MAELQQAQRLERKSSQVVITKSESDISVEASTDDPAPGSFVKGQSGIEFAQPEFDERKDVVAPSEDLLDLLEQNEPVRTEKFDSF